MAPPKELRGEFAVLILHSCAVPLRQFSNLAEYSVEIKTNATPSPNKKKCNQKNLKIFAISQQLLKFACQVVAVPNLLDSVVMLEEVIPPPPPPFPTNKPRQLFIFCFVLFALFYVMFCLVGRMLDALLLELTAFS